MKTFTQLPDEYKEILSVNLQTNKKLSLWINIGSLFLALLMVVPMIFYIPFTLTFNFSSNLPDLLLKLGILIASFVAYVILHELTHAIVMKSFGCKKVNFGFTGLYAYAGSEEYFDKISYILIALAPVVFWGVALAVANVFVPLDWFWVIYLVQVINVSGAIGDFYVTFKFIKLPKDILVQDKGVGMTVYSKENCIKEDVE